MAEPTPTPLPSEVTARVRPVEASPGGFDVSAARADGYSDDEILTHLAASRPAFNMQAALRDGYSKPEIIDHLAGVPAPATASGPGPTSRYLSSVEPYVNPVKIVKGIAHTAADLGGAYQADVAARTDLGNQAVQDFHQGSYVHGVARTLQAMVPLLGPWAAQAGNKGESGDVAGMLGDMTGMGLTVAAPELLKTLPAVNIGKAVRPTAEWLNQTAIKPGGTATPAVKRALSNVSLDEGLTANQAGIDARAALSDQVGGELGALYKSGPQKPTVAPGPVTKALNNLASDVGQASKADATIVQGIRDEFLGNLRTRPGGAVRNLTPAEAFDLKVAHQQKATQMKKGAYEGGADNSAAVSAHQEIASALGDQLVEQFPEAANLNKRYSGLQKIEKPLTAAANKSTNTRLLDSTGIASTILGFATGHTEAGLAGSAAVLAVKLLRDPAIRSQIAIKMARTTRGMTVSAADAAIGGYLNALSRGTQDSGTAPAMQLSPAMAQLDAKRETEN